MTLAEAYNDPPGRGGVQLLDAAWIGAGEIIRRLVSGSTSIDPFGTPNRGPFTDGVIDFGVAADKLTSATATFVGGDVGKFIVIASGPNAGRYEIAVVNSATDVDTATSFVTDEDPVTFSIDDAEIAAATRSATTFPVAGAEVGDFLILDGPPATLNDDLVPLGAKITADGEGTLYLYNPTGGAIDAGASTWSWLLIDLT